MACGLLVEHATELVLWEILKPDVYPDTGCWVFPRDVNETLAYKTETKIKTFLHIHETETSDFCHETRPWPRPCKAETETFFETFNLPHCAKTMNGDVQIKTIYTRAQQ